MRKTIGAAIAAAALAGSAQAVTVANETYEGGTATGWSDNTASDPGTNTGGLTKFLGRFGGGAPALTKTFTLSGTQTSVAVDFDFYRIDSWDYENFTVDLIGDGNVTLASLTRTYNHFDNGANTVYAGWSDNMDSFAFNLSYTGTSLKLQFQSSLDSGISDESWGIDNLRIVDNAVAGGGNGVPEPGVWALMTLGFGLVGWAARRRRTFAVV